MIRKEMIDKYGEELAVKIIDEMRGCTVDVLDDGDFDYRQFDIDRALCRMKDNGEIF